MNSVSVASALMTARDDGHEDQVASYFAAQLSRGEQFTEQPSLSTSIETDAGGTGDVIVALRMCGVSVGA